MRSRVKTRIGVVQSRKMDKTAVVVLTRRAFHRHFGKSVVHREKVKAHDEKNACETGDQVLLVETRPLSREKHWRVEKILRKALETGGVQA